MSNIAHNDNSLRDDENSDDNILAQSHISPLFTEGKFSLSDPLDPSSYSRNDKANDLSSLAHTNTFLNTDKSGMSYRSGINYY